MTTSSQAPVIAVSPNHPQLSAVEQAQLGTVRLCKNGTPSAHSWPDAAQWPTIREHLVERSKASNPLLDETLTAYTPSETVKLLQHPTITRWHQEHVGALESSFERIVLVPCAKTKPWTGPAVSRSRLYSAYNVLKEELPTTCFVTVSEPLGVVPQAYWADFPQYDNPGLFDDDAQRSGMLASDWKKKFGDVYAVPYDPIARASSIRLLGNVLGEFLSHNQDRELVAFVDSPAGKPSTHGLMLDVALETTGLSVRRYPKRSAPRVSPLEWMRTTLSQ